VAVGVAVGVVSLMCNLKVSKVYHINCKSQEAPFNCLR